MLLGNTHLAQSQQCRRVPVSSHTWGSQSRLHRWWTAPPRHQGESGTAWSGDAGSCSHMRSNCHIRSPPTSQEEQEKWVISRCCNATGRGIAESPAQWWWDHRSGTGKVSSWAVFCPSTCPLLQCNLKVKPHVTVMLPRLNWPSRTSSLSPTWIRRPQDNVFLLEKPGRQPTLLTPSTRTEGIEFNLNDTLDSTNEQTCLD